MRRLPLCTMLALVVAARGQNVPAGAKGWSEAPGASVYGWPEAGGLPSGGGFWNILQTREPTAVTEPLDFGGLAGARPPLLSLEANSWTATGHRWNGFDVHEPYQPGRAMFVPDPEALGRVVVRNAPVEASLVSAGPEILAEAADADAGWHGGVSALLTGSALASANLPALARRAGLVRAESFRWYTRDSAKFGGPVGRSAEILVSVTGQWASQRVPHAVEKDYLNTRWLLGTVRGRYRPSGRDGISATLSGTRIDQSDYGWPAGFEPLTARRGAPPLRAAAALREEDHLDSGQVQWRRGPGGGPGPEVELRYGYGVAHLDTPAPRAFVPARIELLDGSLSGPAPLANFAVRTRHQLEALWRSGGPGLGAVAQRLAAGAYWQRSGIRNRLTAPLDTHSIVAGGRPATAVELNTPLDSRARTVAVGFHASGAFEAARWLRIETGLLFEHLRGVLPAQSSPPGVHAPAREFSEEKRPIVWSDAAPRVGMVVAPRWRFSPRWRACYGRYPGRLAGRLLDFANPNSLSGEEYEWQDRDGDGLYEPGEKGLLLRRFGGKYSSIQAGLLRPYVDEFGVEAAASLPGGLEAGLRLFRRDERRRLAGINVGAPFTLPTGEPSYRRLQYPDPGGDGIAGTFDDQVLPVYDQLPETFGRDWFLLANTELDSFSAGVVAQLGAQARRYWWRLSFAAVKAYGTTSFGNDAWENDTGVTGSLLADPNGLTNATGRTFFDRAYMAKFQGVWRLPPRRGGVEFGVVANYWDGAPFGRKLLVEGPAQGPVVILATPRGSPEGGHRTQYQLAVDLRVSREFSTGRGRLRVLADIFNLPNLSQRVRERDVSGPEFNERLPVLIQPPRFVRFGVEWEF